MFTTKINIIKLSILSLGLTITLAACNKGNDVKLPSTEARAIEETEVDGGCDLLSQEFGVECDTEAIEKSQDVVDYVRSSTYASRRSSNHQAQVLLDYPHLETSNDKEFPLRGSWRQSKKDIIDLVDRHIWSPEMQQPVQLMHYFDMILLINVSPRTNQSHKDSSAQRMQVLIRKDDSNLLKDWKRIHTWPISSGLPGGKKIATFTGVYKFDPSRFSEDYYSNQFNKVRMYETMFLYHQYRYQSGDQKTGVAIHGTYANHMLGRRDSGGCIRLARENAKCLFNTFTGEQEEQCLDGGELNYKGYVPSFLPRHGEADPEYLSSGNLEVPGYKVLIAIFNDENDKL